MPGYRLTFRLDPRPAPRATTSRTQAADLEFRRAAYAEIGLKLQSYAWAELDLADPTTTARFTEVVGGLQRAGKVVLGAGYLGEVPTAADTAAAEWFGVQTPGHEAGFNLWDDYPECVAGKTPKNWHAVEDGAFVSERFRRVVEESGASGLEFLWVKDTGRFQATRATTSRSIDAAGPSTTAR